MSSQAVSGFLAALYLVDPAAESDAFSEVALVDSGDHKTYQAAWGSRRWDNQETLTIEQDVGGDGSGWAAITTGFTVDYLAGKITFASAQSAADDFRATGKKHTLIEVVDLTGLSLQGSTKMLGDSSTIRSTFEEYLPGKKNWELDTDLWWVDGTYWEYLAAGRLIAEIYYQYDNTTKKCLVGWAQLDGVKWSMPHDGLQTSKITLQGSEGLVWDTN
jgi:hypothetical protein